MEKRRRARINNCLNELKTLILDAMKKDVSILPIYPIFHIFSLWYIVRHVYYLSSTGTKLPELPTLIHSRVYHHLFTYCKHNLVEVLNYCLFFFV